MTSNAMNDESSYAYRERYVAFLDILGFAHHVDGTPSDGGQVKAIAKVLETIESEKESSDRLTSVTSGAEEAANFYMFSDSIVVTVPATDSGLVRILLDVSFLLRRLLGHSALVRGAIVKGEMYERKHVVFGPGLVEAYKLESTAARYPRVLIAEDICAESQSIPYEVRGRESVPIAVKVRRDFDGLFHLDWMLHYHTVYEPGSRGFRVDGPENYRLFKEAIEFTLNDSLDNPSVKSKAYWLANYFNDVLRRGRSAGLLGGSHDVTDIAL